MLNSVPTESRESKPDLQKPVGGAGGSFAHDLRRTDGLEKEDIAIIVLSAVLIIATVLLALRVL